MLLAVGALGLSACLVCVVFAALLLFSGTGKPDPYEGLPKEPPADLVSFYDRLVTTFPGYSLQAKLQAPNPIISAFQVESDCWHVNHFIRVTAMDFFRTVMNKIATLVSLGKPTRAAADRMEAELKRNMLRFMDLALLELGKCPLDAVIKTPKTSSTVREALEGIRRMDALT